MITPLAIIDLLAVLPFYLYFILPDMRFLRAVRLFRLFRVLKLARYSESLQTFVDVLRLKKEELVLMFFAIMILLIVSSSLMYEAEHEAQPDIEAPHDQHGNLAQADILQRPGVEQDKERTQPQQQQR